jgi:hypothetical protein
MDSLPLNDGINAFFAAAPALGARENLVKTGERRAGYSDIDTDCHVNNARYIQWIQDIIDPALLDKADQLRLDVNYVSEVLPGETVELWSASIDGIPPPDAAAADYPKTGAKVEGFALEGKRQGDGSAQAVFRAELRVRQT